MYSVGDTVFHPTGGAGTITKLERMPAIKKGLRFYRIRMVRRHHTVLRVPVSKAAELGLRPALAEEEVGQILDILLAEPEELPKAHKARYKVCQGRLDTGDTGAIATIIRDLSWRRVVTGKLNAPGQRIFKRAKRLLTGELALTQKIEKQAAEEQIHDALAAGELAFTQKMERQAAEEQIRDALAAGELALAQKMERQAAEEQIRDTPKGMAQTG